MLLARQGLLLTFLDQRGGRIAKEAFQTELSRFERDEEEDPNQRAAPQYEFVRMETGPFSFTAEADMRRLVERGLVLEARDAWELTATGRMAARRVKPPARGGWPADGARAEKDEVRDEMRTRREAGLLTIGYEGRSLENYLNALLGANVTVLCDVRRNPLSRKYGFAKNSLRQACEAVRIRYEHLPELGIASEERKELKTRADYEALFARYERETLPRKGAALEKIRAWIEEEGERVALTCYEAEPCECHRHCVADVLARGGEPALIPRHL